MSEKKRERIGNRVDQQFFTDLEKLIKDRDLQLDDFRQEVAQRNIFVVIDDYVYAFPSESESLTACNNLIKRVKRIATQLHMRSVEAQATS